MTARAQQRERMVSAMVALATVEEIDPRGQGGRGGYHRPPRRRTNPLTLTPREEARLDSLGALGPVGCSEADLTATEEAIRAAYIESRQSAVAGAGPGF
jgi:hypothetical protein